jgi:hypothetical protein
MPPNLTRVFNHPNRKSARATRLLADPSEDALGGGEEGSFDQNEDILGGETEANTRAGAKQRRLTAVRAERINDF